MSCIFSQLCSPAQMLCRQCWVFLASSHAPKILADEFAIHSRMPHSSRRTRKPFHAKRVISESEDGWSRVERTLSSRFGSAMIISESLPPVDRSLTVQKLQDEHKRCKQQWVDSEARQSLQQLLTRRMPEGGWPVDKAVCVALGSPSLSWANRNRSVWQLVMFMDLVDIGRN